MKKHVKKTRRSNEPRHIQEHRYKNIEEMMYWRNSGIFINQLLIKTYKNIDTTIFKKNTLKQKKVKWSIQIIQICIISLILSSKLQCV